MSRPLYALLLVVMAFTQVVRSQNPKFTETKNVAPAASFQNAAQSKDVEDCA